MPVDLSIIVPVYNSQETLPELFARLKQAIEGMGRTFEVIFVEDCGQDQSWGVICQLKEQHPEHVVGIKMGRNFGQHNATLCGFHHARGKFLVTIDDDLQIPPEELPKLVAEQERTGADLVYGCYAVKKHGPLRNLASLAIQKVQEMTFEGAGKNSSFRLITAALADKIKGHRQSYVYLDGLFLWYTRYVARTLVRHEERRHGRSGYDLVRMMRLAANLFFNFTTLPLRWIIYLGIVCSAISFALGVTFMIRKLLYDVPLGWTSIMVTIFFSGSVILLVLGIIGEYISRIFSLHNARPQFSIREIR